MISGECEVTLISEFLVNFTKLKFHSSRMAGSLAKGILCLKQYLLDQNSEGSSTVMIQTWSGRKDEFM